MAQWEVLTGRTQTLQGSSDPSDMEPKKGTVWGTYRQWTDCTRHKCSQWHRTNRRYSRNYWNTLNRHYKESVDAVTQNKQMLHCGVLTDFRQTVQDNRESNDTQPTEGRMWCTVLQSTSGHRDTEPTDGTVCSCNRQWTTVQDTCGRSDRELTDGTVWSTDRYWTESTRHQWNLWHRKNKW